MAANQFGKIKFQVQVDRKSFQTGIKQAEKGIDGLVARGARLSSVGAQLRGLGEGVNRLGRRLAFGGALFSAPFVAASKSAGEFERKLASIKVNIGSRIRVDPKLKASLDAVSGDAVAGVRLINKEYGNLEKTFKRLARQFPKGPSEIAGAATQLARAGVSKSLIQGGSGKNNPKDAGRGGILRPLVQLSVADTTGASLDEITDKTIKLLKAFDLLREGAGKSTEQMAKDTTSNLATILKASTQANVSVISLAESMKFAGGILASSVKADKTGNAFREVIAVTSVLQERLGDASIAGTALRGMMLRLKSPTGAVAKTLKAAGFSIQSIRDASDSGRAGLLEMLKAIEAVRGSTSKPQFEDFLGKIFENRQITAALSLIDETGDRLSQRVKDMEIDGDPEKFFDQFESILNDNVAGAVGRTKSAIDNLSLAIGGALSEAVQGVLRVIQDFADVISKFAEENPQVVKTVAILAAALVPLGVGVAGLGAAFSTLSLPIIAAGLAMQNFTKFAAAANAPFALLKKTALGIVSPFEAAAKLQAGGGASFFGAGAAGGISAASGAGVGSGAVAARRSLPVLGGKAPVSTLPIVSKPAPPRMPIVGGKTQISTLPIVKRPPATQMGLFGDNGDAKTFNRMASIDRSKLAPAPKKPSGQMLLPMSGSNTDPRVPKSLGFGPKLSKKSAGIIKKLEMPAKDMARGGKKWKTLTKQLGRLGIEARKLSISELQVAVAALQTKLAAQAAVPAMLPKKPMSQGGRAFGMQANRKFLGLPQSSGLMTHGRKLREAEREKELARRIKMKSPRDTSLLGPQRSAVFGDFFAGKGKAEPKRRKRSMLSKARLRMKDRFTSVSSSAGAFGGMFGESTRSRRKLDLAKGVGARGIGGKIAAGSKAAAGNALAAGAKAATTLSSGLAGVATGFASVVGTVAKFVIGIGLAISKFAILAGLITTVVISGNTIGNAFDSIQRSFKKTGEAFGKSFGAISKTLESLKFEKIGGGAESAGDRINKVLKTIKVSAKAVFFSLATEIFSGIVDLGITVMTSLLEGVKNLISGLFDFISSMGSKDGGMDPFQAMKQAFVRAREDSLAELDAVVSEAEARSSAGRKAKDDLTAEFLGLDKSKSLDPEELQRKRDEIADKFNSGEFGKGMAGIQNAASELRSAAVEINKAKLLEAGTAMSDALITATDEFRQKISLIDKMLDTGQINERRASQFRGLAQRQFRESSPMIKAAEEHREAAKQLMEAGKSLEGKLDPRVSLKSTVEEYSDLLASGAINLKTFREAVADAERAESRRLDSIEDEREKDGFSSKGSGQLGGGVFFSKFSSFLGGTESESTLRRNNLKANIDFLGIAKTAFKTVQEKLSNTDFGIAVKQTMTDLSESFAPVTNGLNGAAEALKDAAASLGLIPERIKKTADLDGAAQAEAAGVRALSPTSRYMQRGQDPAMMDPYSRSINEFIQGYVPPKPKPEVLPESVTQPRASFLQRKIDKNFLMSGFYQSESDKENRERDYRTDANQGIAPSRFGGFRANGGPVSAGGSYVVGEKGPELFFPTQTGHILSNGLSKKVDGMFAGGTIDEEGFFSKFFPGGFEQVFEAAEFVGLRQGDSESKNAFREMTNRITDVRTSTEGRAFSPSEFDPTGELERKFSELDYDQVREMSESKSLMQNIDGVNMQGTRTGLGLDAFKELGRRDAQERSDRMQAQKLKAFDIMEAKKVTASAFKQRGGVARKDSIGYDLSSVSQEDLDLMANNQVAGINPSNMSLQGELAKRSRLGYGDSVAEDSMMTDFGFAGPEEVGPDLTGTGLKLAVPGTGGMTLDSGLSNDRLVMDNYDSVGNEFGDGAQVGVGDSLKLNPNPSPIVMPDDKKMAKDRQRKQRADRKRKMEEARQRRAEEEQAKKDRLAEADPDRLARQGFQGQNTAANRKKARLAAVRNASGARLAGSAVGRDGNMLVSTNGMPQPAVDAGRAGAAARNNQKIDLSQVAQETTMGGISTTLSAILRNLQTNGGMGQ